MLPLMIACSGPAPQDPPPAEASCTGDDGGPAAFLVQPYVQAVSETEAWIYWETDAGEGSRVDCGRTASLGEVACGERVPLWPAEASDERLSQVHAVQLVGLQPGEAIYYAARTGASQSAVQHFRTAGEGPFRIVAMSDSQMDRDNPDQFLRVIQEGVIPTARER